MAFAVPVVAALLLAYSSAVDFERTRAEHFAEDALRRAEVTIAQIGVGAQRIVRSGSDLCSPAAIAEMRAIDLVSSYIQAVGHVVGNRMVCSSIAGTTASFDLGPPDRVQPNGSKLRSNVTFPFAPGQSFIVIERWGLAAIIHKQLPLDATVNSADTSVALTTRDGQWPIATIGFFDPAWKARIRDPSVSSFVDDDHIVAIARSRRFFFATVASLPRAAVADSWARTAMQLIPIALAAAILMGFGTYRLVNLQASPAATMKRGMRRGQFHVVYQPIVELGSGRWVGAEALVRWNIPGAEPLTPSVFIPAAEQSGIIQDLTRHICMLVARDIRQLLEDNPEFYVSINLSAADLGDSRILDLIRTMLASENISPRNLVLEATEHCFVDHAQARPIIQDLRKLGLRFAIDDFGTGYSGLSMLEDFEADVLKIDKSFVDALTTDAPSRRVIPHIIEMGKSLSLAMVAEGIEHQRQADQLRTLGVQFGQGYLFGKPMPMDEFRRAFPAADTPAPRAS